MPRTKKHDRPCRLSTTIPKSLKLSADVLLRDKNGKLPVGSYQKIIREAFENFIRYETSRLTTLRKLQGKG